MYSPENRAADQVRFLASRGELATTAATASPSDYAWLRRGGYEISWPVVFEGLTRGIERGRGHHGCAEGVEHLQPDCLDRFEDDVEAVVTYLLAHANVPIRNVEGWIRSRLVRATIDGHRRRRGERGAVQRPRIPNWLADLLGDDRWLTALAIHIQTWVGIPATAGTGLWPYSAWAERRMAVTGDPDGTEHDVASEVERVLAAMRKNPAWYERYIERPLGGKQAPLLLTDVDGPARDRSHLALTQRHELDDALLAEFAALAIEAMAARIARGEDRRLVVVDIIQTVFGAGTGAEHLDQPPRAGTGEDEWIHARLADPESIKRIVRQVLDILDIPDA
jgi:hypothetical protein